MPRKICLAFPRFGSLFSLTSSVSADGGSFIVHIVRLLAIQQPGNTHGIYHARHLGLAILNCSHVKLFARP